MGPGGRLGPMLTGRSEMFVGAGGGLLGKGKERWVLGNRMMVLHMMLGSLGKGSVRDGRRMGLLESNLGVEVAQLGSGWVVLLVG